MSPLPVADMQGLYAEIDRAITAFKLATGLRCRSQCGQCCPEASIAVTMVEMLPAAAALLASGDIQHWLAKLADAGRTCVAFSPDPLPETGGHCRIYEHRPVVCRLFGFAAIRNRLGKLELSTCRPIRQDFPEAVSRAEALLAKDIPAPLLTGYSQRLFGLDPTAHPMPINQALARAIQRCGLFSTLDTPPGAEPLPRAG